MITIDLLITSFNYAEKMAEKVAVIVAESVSCPISSSVEPDREAMMMMGSIGEMKKQYYTWDLEPY